MSSTLAIACGLLLVSFSIIVLPQSAVYGHGVPKELQGKRVQVHNEQFSDQTLNTGEQLTVTGELVNIENNTLDGLSLSLSLETRVEGKSWEITYKSLGETFDIPVAGRVPFEMRIVPLKPGLYHVHTQVNIANDETPTLGRGQTVSVMGNPIATPAEAMSCSPEQVMQMMTRNATAEEQETFEMNSAARNTTGIIANQTSNITRINSGLISEPQVVVTENHIHVVWSDFNNTAGNLEIYYKKSDDLGGSFSKVINLSNTTAGDSLYPQVFAVRNNLFVIWEEVSGNGANVALCKKSSDSGDTFDQAIRQSNVILTR